MNYFQQKLANFCLKLIFWKDPYSSTPYVCRSVFLHYDQNLDLSNVVFFQKFKNFGHNCKNFDLGTKNRQKPPKNGKNSVFLPVFTDFRYLNSIFCNYDQYFRILGEKLHQIGLNSYHNAKNLTCLTKGDIMGRTNSSRGNSQV